jgi:hypothetical protein
MNDPSHWPLDQDPPRDEALARVLRAAEGTAPGDEAEWERLRAAIMMSAASAGRPAAPAREWLDVVVQWRRVAVAASVAAILTAGALVWGSDAALPEVAIGDDTAPESVAVARVVAAYPDDAVFGSLLQTARTDDLTSWGAR